MDHYSTQEIFEKQEPENFIYLENPQSFDSIDSSLYISNRNQINQQKYAKHVQILSKPINAKTISPHRRKLLKKIVRSQDKNILFYKGSEAGFKGKLDSLSDEQVHTLSQVYIYISGNQITPGNSYCLIITIILSILLIAPIFIMYFDWWKKIVYPCFEISCNFYQSLNKLSQKSLQSLTLLVNDNNFGKQKALIMSKLLSNAPKMIGFTFINFAEPIDYQQNEYSKFKQNMRETKRLSIMTDLRWFRQIVKDS